MIVIYLELTSYTYFVQHFVTFFLWEMHTSGLTSHLKRDKTIALFDYRFY